MRTERVLKFGSVATTGATVEFAYGDTWQREETASGPRLVIGPRSRQTAVMLALRKAMPEPYGVLYVLVVSRCDHEDARYQSPTPVGAADMDAFLQEYAAYFEGDGRHHVWVQSLGAPATIVYDQHDVIYAYGPLAEFEQALRGLGFSEGEVAIPVPHEHRYHAQFDATEDRIMAHWTWHAFPLQSIDLA